MIQILNGPEPDKMTEVLFGLFAAGLSAYVWRRAGREPDAFRRKQARRGAVFLLLVFGGIAVWGILTRPW